MDTGVVLRGRAQDVTANRHPHVLFLNAQTGVGADIAVHLSLARTLDRDQVRVTAATSMHAAPGESAGEAFSAVPDLKVLPLGVGLSLSGRRGLDLASAVLDNARGTAGLVGLARWCRRNGVDLVHVTERPRQAIFGLLLARMAGCAYLVHAHTSHYPHDNSRLATWRLRQADAVVGVSRFTARTFVDIAGVPASKVYAVHNAVDASAFNPDAAGARRSAMRARFGIPSDAPVIGYVARLTRAKDQAALLDAFAHVRETFPTARLVLPGTSADVAPDGEGSYGDYLQRRIRALRLAGAVLLPGFLPRTEMPGFYAALDAVAHPCIEEPFGLAVVEGMASAKPVVAAAGGGIPEIIRDNVDGLLVPPGRPDTLAAALVRVLSEPALSSRLAAAGRARALSAFTPRHQADAMLDVYRDVITRRRGS
jgi:glycosyltransferase involved in cell wall biosynthesis